jgi:hypothetical protein
VRNQVRRYPARSLFLVTRIRPATAEEIAAAGAASKKEEEWKDAKEITVAADKQKALLIEGPTVLPAPMWEREATAAKCKVIVNPDGKITELETGAQLCEIVPWFQFSYKPTLQGGKPVKVHTEVEVRYEPLK